MADQDTESIDLNKHPSEIVPKIQNIVSTVNLDCKLNLKQIALKARNAEYNPRRFAAVIMRLKDPKTTALIFQSGKVYACVVQKLGFPAKFKDFKIQNIVTSCDVNFLIRLETLQYHNSRNYSAYDPEIFPGMIYKMKKPLITMLIFGSGKVVIVGVSWIERGVERHTKNRKN
ncbi:hypothetical protein MKW94_019865 [Papaver nudicaule]|uniref:TATA-box-binding protein n=1 Tax=Papaver nudicaule TaxID=74823 RepID=A0AA41S187_PAPNU|nr:hypothetical protein [Papaver nudicaule]